ncbi:MAG: hypothetical protein CL581_09550 [Alteromonadaceae bacterium]|jgi:hypothetical protein|nr:hypothetical protein [Alteromonadaceae bacterium]
MSLVIQGSLILTDVLNGHPQDYQVRQLQEDCESRYGLIAIAQPHMTILTSRDLKPLQKRSGMSNREFREWMKEMIPTFLPAPDVVINASDVYSATEGEKASCYLILSNYLSFLLWRAEIMLTLGVLGDDIDPSRFFHISIANLTGNRVDSVANPRGEEE